jgi:hypothetical protein
MASSVADDYNIENIKNMLSPKYGLVLIKYIVDNEDNVTTMILKINEISNKTPNINSQGAIAYSEHDETASNETKEKIENSVNSKHYLLRIDIIDHALEKQKQLETDYISIKQHIDVLKNINVLKEKQSVIPITISDIYSSTIIKKLENKIDFLFFLFKNDKNQIRKNICSVTPNKEIRTNSFIFNNKNLNLKEYSKMLNNKYPSIKSIIEKLFKNLNDENLNDENLNDENLNDENLNDEKQMLVSIIDYSNRSSTFYSRLEGIENDIDDDDDDDDDDDNDEQKCKQNNNQKDKHNYIYSKNNLLAFYMSLFKYKGIVSFDAHLNNMLINKNEEIVIIDFEQFMFFNNISFDKLKEYILYFKNIPLINDLIIILENIINSTNNHKYNNIDKNILEDFIILLFIEYVSIDINYDKKINSYLQIFLLNYENDTLPTKTNAKVSYSNKNQEESPIKFTDLIKTLTELSILKNNYFHQELELSKAYQVIHSVIFPQITSDATTVEKGGFKKSKKTSKKNKTKTSKKHQKTKKKRKKTNRKK